MKGENYDGWIKMSVNGRDSKSQFAGYVMLFRLSINEEPLRVDGVTLSDGNTDPTYSN
jgi:hypothetical protein